MKKSDARWVCCDKCPILNRDFEDGSGCNLGYYVELVMTDINALSVHELSPNCRLMQIQTKDIDIVVVETALRPANKEVENRILLLAGFTE